MRKSQKKKKGRLASCAGNKGLLNQPGENNCFLNSAIQVLWHLAVFRRSFRLLTGHACLGVSCIFCALKMIFEQFEYSKDTSLDPNALRNALAETFHEQNRFQIGRMDDAAECFENILTRIHIHIANEVDETQSCTIPHCIPHQKFGMSLLEQLHCSCEATSEPDTHIEMVHYVASKALCNTDREMRMRNKMIHDFGKLIRLAGSDEGRVCPSKCGETSVECRRILMNSPDVISIGIVWDTAQASLEEISELLCILGTTLKISDLFSTVVDEKTAKKELVLVGMVCYYGKHYSTYFFHSGKKRWIYFDDAYVVEVGKRWSEVVIKCERNHHQPLLLLYTNPDADPVSVTVAPRHNTEMSLYTSSADPFSSSPSHHQNGLNHKSEPKPSKDIHEKVPLPRKPVTEEDVSLRSNGTLKSQKTRLKTSHEKSTSSISSFSSSLADHMIPDEVQSASSHSSSTSLTSSTESHQRKKPAFTWNRKQDNKIRGYNEPVTAQWTTYTPYPNSVKTNPNTKKDPNRSNSPNLSNPNSYKGLFISDVDEDHSSLNTAYRCENLPIIPNRKLSNYKTVTSSSSSSSVVSSNTTLSNNARSINSSVLKKEESDENVKTSNTDLHDRNSHGVSKPALPQDPPADHQKHQTTNLTGFKPNQLLTNKLTDPLNTLSDRVASSQVLEADMLVKQCRLADEQMNYQLAYDLVCQALEILQKIHLSSNELSDEISHLFSIKYDETNKLAKILRRRKQLRQEQNKYSNLVNHKDDGLTEMKHSSKDSSSHTDKPSIQQPTTSNQTKSDKKTLNGANKSATNIFVYGKPKEQKSSEEAPFEKIQRSKTPNPGLQKVQNHLSEDHKIRRSKTPTPNSFPSEVQQTFNLAPAHLYPFQDMKLYKKPPTKIFEHPQLPTSNFQLRYPQPLPVSSYNDSIRSRLAIMASLSSRGSSTNSSKIYEANKPKPKNKEEPSMTSSQLMFPNHFSRNSHEAAKCDEGMLKWVHGVQQRPNYPQLTPEYRNTIINEIARRSVRQQSTYGKSDSNPSSSDASYFIKCPFCGSTRSTTTRSCTNCTNKS